MVNGPNGKWIGYGLGDEGPQVAVIQRRLLFAYPRNSKAVENGVAISGRYDTATVHSVQDITRYMNGDARIVHDLARRHIDVPLRADGIANAAVQYAIGAAIPPPPKQRFPIQGVYANSNAFLNPDPHHSYVEAINEFAREGVNLYSRMVGRPIIPIGYSMGGDSVRRFLESLPPEWRDFVRMVVTLGDPAMPDGGSLLGDTTGGGIAGVAQPLWVQNRYYSYSIPGDWYPECRTPVLRLLYQILIRAELSMDFAMYLFTVLPTQIGQVLLGQQASNAVGFGALSSLLPLVTGASGLLGPMAIFAVLPQLLTLLFDAIKFVATNAHGGYADPRYALWDGMTAVDHAAAKIRDLVPEATLFLFPGTWAMWNQGFPMDIAARLSSATMKG